MNLLQKIIHDIRSGETSVLEEQFRSFKEMGDGDAEAIRVQLRNIPEEDLRLFINLNNQVTGEKLSGIKLEKILVLVPFCLQNRDCKHRIVWHIENCKRCGKCKIGEIQGAVEEYGARVRVAVRARFAAQFAEEENPDLILATACEEELIAGLISTRKYLTYCIPLLRPNGYCIDTTIDLDTLRDTLKKFHPATVKV